MSMATADIVVSVRVLSTRLKLLNMTNPDCPRGTYHIRVYEKIRSRHDTLARYIQVRRIRLILPDSLFQRLAERP